VVLREWCRLGLFAAWPVLMVGGCFSESCGETTDAERRLQQSVGHLASEEMHGRGPGTDGIEKAAEWIAGEFAAVGLAPPAADSVVRQDGNAWAGWQPFEMTLDAKLGPADANRVELVGPVGADGSEQVIPLELGRDYTPLAAGGSGEFDLPLAFLGYGITAPQEEYDDYAGIDAKGDAVVLMRHEPQQDNPHSVFDGNQNSRHAALSRKIANASEHEVGGVIFINDAVAVERNKEDALMAFDRAGDGSEARRMPILQLQRSVLEPVVSSVLGKPMADLEAAIDEGLAPQSAELAGWRIRGSTAIERQTTTAQNVLAVLPGEGPLADEVVVLGAHYDHLGMGGTNSAAPGVEAIHHGADDNASGTAALIEVARQLAARGPFPRTVLFAAFSGEERGLLGSAHYTANPAMPLEKTVAMINLDMVGRLTDNKLIVHGTGTGTTMEQLVEKLLEGRHFTVTKEPGGFGPSDHSSFYAKKMPVLHLFTGSHEDYHRPTDTAEKINYEGMTRIVDFVSDIVAELAATETPPEYVQVASTQFAGGGGDRPYFGSIPDFATSEEGYAISGVAKDSPAATGGLEGGDVIIRLGESAVKGLEDFDNALRKYRGGDTVTVVVRRGGMDVSLEVTLAAPR
jgi:hypothetical protein